MPTRERDAFRHALAANAAWAAFQVHQNPTYFSDLADHQSPKILWIGCSDSRVPESTILGLQPGEAFVHRNVAAAVTPSDISAFAVVEYAVRYLKVEHIILSGHTNCGGCVGTLAEAELGGVLDSWLAPLAKLYAAHKEELKAIEDPAARAIRLAEIGVESGVATIMNNPAVKAAVAERGLQVHGTIYNTGTGLLRDMKIGTSPVDEPSEDESQVNPPVVPRQRDVLRGNHGVLVFNDNGHASMGIL